MTESFHDTFSEEETKRFFFESHLSICKKCSVLVPKFQEQYRKLRVQTNDIRSVYHKLKAENNILAECARIDYDRLVHELLRTRRLIRRGKRRLRGAIRWLRETYPELYLQI